MLLLITATVLIINSFPINLAIVFPWTKVVLSNSVITLQVFNPYILSVKNSLYLTIANVFRSKIVD